MAEPDIAARAVLSKRLAPAPSSFDRWAKDKQYDTAPAVCPSPTRIYADRQTQDIFEAYMEGRRGRASDE